jgi:hypothetical protein
MTMRPLSLAALLLGFVSICSCAKRERDPAYPEFMTKLGDAIRDYRSADITVAEKGLLNYRLWLIGRLEADKTNSAGYKPSLCRTDERLFQLYEFKGQTNEADLFYQEGMELRKAISDSKHRPERPMTKQQLREELNRQEKGEEIAWKNGSKRSTFTPER